MNKNTGFTLIEVLVSIMVLSIGLLGLAGLLATSLKSNQSAYNRSQAAQLAYDLADRMRTNIGGMNTYITIDPADAAAQAACLTTAGCSQSEMAENDLYEWNLQVTNTLPNGAGTLTVTPAPPPADPADCTAKVGGLCMITINWSDGNSFETSFQL
ncbi:MAG: type IV pilus modification protein PilV [Methylococcales bacterium]|nr:type IV pilus modification protein PilV [Methylococcales bacterium]